MNYTGLTLEQAQAKYNLYLKAEEAILTAQEYEIEGRKITRASLPFVREGLKFWESKCNELGNGKVRGIGAFRGIGQSD